MGKYDDRVFWRVDGPSLRGPSATKYEVIIFSHTKSITFLLYTFNFIQKLTITFFLTFFIDFVDYKNKNTKNSKKIIDVVVKRNVKVNVDCDVTINPPFI
jgi:hypothetical protein